VRRRGDAVTVRIENGPRDDCPVVKKRTLEGHRETGPKDGPEQAPAVRPQRRSDAGTLDPPLKGPSLEGPVRERTENGPSRDPTPKTMPKADPRRRSRDGHLTARRRPQRRPEAVYDESRRLGNALKPPLDGPLTTHLQWAPMPQRLPCLNWPYSGPSPDVRSGNGGEPRRMLSPGSVRGPFKVRWRPSNASRRREAANEFQDEAFENFRGRLLGPSKPPRRTLCDGPEVAVPAVFWGHTTRGCQTHPVRAWPGPLTARRKSKGRQSFQGASFRPRGSREALV